jgi:hypothetical protein
MCSGGYKDKSDVVLDLKMLILLLENNYSLIVKYTRWKGAPHPFPNTGTVGVQKGPFNMY